MAYPRRKTALSFDVDEGGWLPLLNFLIAWANAPYTVVLGTVLLFALLSASGILGLLAGGDHDGGDDVDGDAHDVDGHEADHDAGDGHESDHDHDKGDDDRGFAHAITGALGIGKLPFSLVWQVFGAIFALTGLAANAHYLDRPGGPPLFSLAWTMPIALSVAYGVVAALARVLTPIVADEKANATTRAELVGHVGKVISTRVDEAFGEVRFRDKTGHDVRLIVKLAAGHTPAREGDEVVFVENTDGALFVAPLEEEESSQEEWKEGKKNDVSG
jgi:membrane protein implicated in regulation of membrane protease activity